MPQKHYKVGIDVGLNSVGFACVELDDHDTPIRVLNTQSVIHDAGVDPTQNKSGTSRKALAGVARRMRRLVKRRRERLKQLDKTLVSLGYPLVDPSTLDSPLASWIMRSHLASEFIADEQKRREEISIAVRAIARNRGWRNPYTDASSVWRQPVLSPMYAELRENACKEYGIEILPEDATVGQIVGAVTQSYSGPAIRIRKTKTGANSQPRLLPQRFMQTDLAYELNKIFSVQRVESEEGTQILKRIFHAKSPKGSSQSLVGKDPLAPRYPRALKASVAFQKFRIAAVICNLRIEDVNNPNGVRCLSVQEKQDLFTLFEDASQTENKILWEDAADLLGVAMERLRGIGGPMEDGLGRVPASPPQIDTLSIFSDVSPKKFKKKITAWWFDHSEDDREHLIELLGNTVNLETVQDDPNYAEVIAFFEGLDDVEMEKLDSLRMKPGRAAYSISTLRSLTERMLTSNDDLRSAQKHLFHIGPEWKPPVPDIAEPVGNPAVDRVLKIVSRYLLACTGRWGVPHAVHIEHVRSAFSGTVSQINEKREYEKTLAQRTSFRKELAQQYGTEDRSLLRRYEAIERQNGQCLYCGKPIAAATSEMDHIVPRKGSGSTNTKTNLAAVCVDCNRSKSNTVFAVWAERPESISRGVSLEDACERVDHFLFKAGSYTSKEQRSFREAVKTRLKRTSADQEIDNRSIESVAWMANELHSRIEYFYTQRSNQGTGDTKDVGGEGKAACRVLVFRGAVTAEARKASHIEGRIHFLKSKRKTRLDRRHHAVDAAVIAMMSATVAQVLEVRRELRQEYDILGRVKEGGTWWKDYPTTTDSHYLAFQRWLASMEALLRLLNEALDTDRVAVLQRVRLGLGNSKGHDDTVHALCRQRVCDAAPIDLINRASTPALYCALTRASDFSTEAGLPENPNRILKVNGRLFTPHDSLAFFKGTAAQILVRGGSAEVGNSVHHARIYRCSTFLKSGKEKIFYGMVRVFAADLRRANSSNLFTYPLPDHSISLRYAEPRTRDAISLGNATCIGHLSVGEELYIPLNFFSLSGQIGEFYQFFSDDSDTNLQILNHWVVSGFFGSSRLRLRPRYVAAEGLGNLRDDVPAGVNEILAGQGWRPSVDVVAAFSPKTLWRNTLGEVRWRSQSGLPCSWEWI